MSISKLVQMRVKNFGCIGPEGIDVSLDNIVCLVGPNNAGKSTVLRAYAAAVGMMDLKTEEIHAGAKGAPASVELWVHIPAGAENIPEKWKEPKDDLLLVRSKWEWSSTGGKPKRWTWDPQSGEYAADTKASGIDNVFNSRLPKPFVIGALEDPAKEHGKLLELVLEPIKSRLSDLLEDDTSSLRHKIDEVKAEAESPVAEFRKDLAEVQRKVNTAYRSVFDSSEVKLSVGLGDLTVDPLAALMKGSAIEIAEPHGQTRWSQQGTGSQRALFWSMLEVRSELNRLSEQRKQQEKNQKEAEKELAKLREKLTSLKKQDAIERCKDDIKRLESELEVVRKIQASDEVHEDTFLPGYMLLIEEPETALHPSAIRAAKEHLYSLAAESGWQVMLSTHHPVFIDPLKDHTTIVRLSRPEIHEAPHVYRADQMQFTPDERENLKSLLAFDTGVAEMFFGSQPVIVEGDTEYAAFGEVMNSRSQDYPLASRPLIVRARGKATIPTLMRMLTHFKVSFAVLHDVDAPRTGDGKKSNGMYTFNKQICSAVQAAEAAGLKVTHRCSCPCFELQHGMSVPAKDKPFEAIRAVRADANVKESVTSVLDTLIAAVDKPGREECYEPLVKEWASVHAAGDPAYSFTN